MCKVLQLPTTGNNVITNACKLARSGTGQDVNANCFFANIRFLISLIDFEIQFGDINLHWGVVMGDPLKILNQNKPQVAT